MKSVLLLLAVHLVGCEVVDLNESVDQHISRFRDMLHRGCFQHFPTFIASEEISFSEFFMCSLASFERKGNCTVTKEGGKSMYEYYVGFGFLSLMFGHFKLNGEDMAAVVRIKDNALRVTLTADNLQGRCSFAIGDLKVTKLKKIVFSSSNNSYEESDMEDIFETVVLPYVNAYIAKWRHTLDMPLQNIWCVEKIQDPMDLIFKLF